MSTTETTRPVETVSITVPIRDDQTGEVNQYPTLGEIVAPGLAITPALGDNGAFKGGWMLTHIESGYCIVPRALCLNCLRAAVDQIRDRADWNRGMSSVIADEEAKAASSVLVHAYVDCRGYVCGRYEMATPTEAVTR